ncbi:HD-GYP domain-containing protein [Paenibacillus sp. P26]|nr:HD-GYP domain-containing protein [Paenibacillus sp. P26]
MKTEEQDGDLPYPAPNPFRRFTLTLGVSVLLMGIALSSVILWAGSSFVLRETVSVTEAAVSTHFAKIPQLGKVFGEDGRTPDAGAGTSGATAGAAEHQHSASGVHGTSQDYDTLNSVVRMHFDLYSITDTYFYYPDGLITFSYDKNDIGRTVPEDKKEAFRQAVRTGQVVTKRVPGHLLYIWVPVKGDQGQVTGLVELTRDMAGQDRLAGRLDAVMLAIIVLGMLALFFGLRKVFISSAQIIDRNNLELGRMVDVIERTYDESLQALSSALDSRDNETQGHSFRVTSYAIRLGMELGLSGQELGSLARGAPLHDVGKIGVPDAILLKPDKLTAEEWEVMRRHVEIGYQMLSHITFLESSLEVVKHHHERWDGKGYPSQLKEREIPLFARIFAVCDTYDAITSDRPYRKGRSCEEAREEIRKCAGTQFCPEVTEAFLRIDPEEWQAIRLHSQTAQSGEPLGLGRLQVPSFGKRRAG